MPATFTVDPPLAQDELSTYYGISISGWSAAENDQILVAVRDSAIAIAIQSKRAPIDAFNAVMRRPNQDTQATYITISKSGAGDTCLTTAGVPTTIVCGTGIVLSKYTIVHELGHVFDNRSDQSVNSNPSTSLEEYVANTNSGTNQPIVDSNDPPRPVMGTFINRYTQDVYWDRGPRGWGTGPASNYGTTGTTKGIALTRILTNMQQNSPPYNGVVPNKEAAADMFLNWIYRTLDPQNSDPFQPPNGFKNISWDSWESADLNTGFGVCNVTAGCADSVRKPGDARFNWMNTNMTQIFTAHNWNQP